MENAANSLGECSRVVRIHEQRAWLPFDREHLAQHVEIIGHDRNAGLGGLDHRKPERFDQRREYENIERAEEVADPFGRQLSDKMQSIENAEGAGGVDELLACGALSGERQMPVAIGQQPYGGCEILGWMKSCCAAQEHGVGRKPEELACFVTVESGRLALEAMVDPHNSLAIAARIAGIFLFDRAGIDHDGLEPAGDAERQIERVKPPGMNDLGELRLVMTMRAPAKRAASVPTTLP